MRDEVVAAVVGVHKVVDVVGVAARVEVEAAEEA